MVRDIESFEFDTLYAFVRQGWPDEIYDVKRVSPTLVNARAVSENFRVIDLEIEIEARYKNLRHNLIYMNIDEAIRVVAQEVVDREGVVRLSDVDKSKVRSWFERKIADWQTEDHGTADLAGRDKYYRDNNIRVDAR